MSSVRSNVPKPELRIEFFLHSAITGEPCDLKPSTVAELYLNSLITGDTSGAYTFSPRTVLEMYLRALVTGDLSNLPHPETIEDMFLYSSITGEDFDIEPITPMEKYLSLLRNNANNEYPNIVGQAIVGYTII